MSMTKCAACIITSVQWNGWDTSASPCSRERKRIVCERLSVQNERFEMKVLDFGSFGAFYSRYATQWVRNRRPFNCSRTVKPGDRQSEAEEPWISVQNVVRVHVKEVDQFHRMSKNFDSLVALTEQSENHQSQKGTRKKVACVFVWFHDSR